MKSFETYIKSAGEEIYCSYKSKVLEPKSFVIILTGDGIKGSKSRTWIPLIEALLKNNFGVLIFDFISQGNSKGKRDKLNIFTGITNLSDALNFFDSKLNINKLYAVASSFGGSVLLNSKDILPKLSKIVFKSPASDLLETYESEHTEKEMIEWKINKISPVTQLSFNAYLSSLKINSYKYFDLISCQTLIIQGNEDEIVPIKQSKRLNYLLGNNSKLIILEGVKHNYKQNNAIDVFVSKTINFLNQK